jgi:hypothetical protein
MSPPPIITKPSSSSSTLSSGTDDDDDIIYSSPSLVDGPAMPRSCLKKYYDKRDKQFGGFLIDSMPIMSPSDTTYKPNRVQFAVQLEEVFYVQNVCNLPCIGLWSTKDDYVNRYYADRKVATNPKTESSIHTKKGSLTMAEWEYLLVYNKAYIQFCSDGNVDKATQRSLVVGIEFGYRALERFSLDYRRRLDFCKRIRKSTIRMYKLLEVQRRADKSNNSTNDESELFEYLRRHCENLNFHHSRWALFMGRLDRIAARRCMKTNANKATMQSYQAITIHQPRLSQEFSSSSNIATFVTYDRSSPYDKGVASEVKYHGDSDNRSESWLVIDSKPTDTSKTMSTSFLIV